MTHGDHETYPQLAREIGFITPDKLLETAEKIITIQRDYGNRSVRKMHDLNTRLMREDLNGSKKN